MWGRKGKPMLFRRRLRIQIEDIFLQGVAIMSKLEDVKAANTALKDSLTKVSDAVDAVKSAVEALKANQGNPDAVAAVDEALADFASAKDELNADSTKLTKTATDAGASGGPVG